MNDNDIIQKLKDAKPVKTYIPETGAPQKCLHESYNESLPDSRKNEPRGLSCPCRKCSPSC